MNHKALVLFFVALIGSLGLIGFFFYRGIPSMPPHSVYEKDLPGGGKIRVLYPTTDRYSGMEERGGEMAIHEVAWGGDKPRTIKVLVDAAGLLIDGVDYGDVSGATVVVDARNEFKVTVNDVERQPAPKKEDAPIPTGSYRLSVVEQETAPMLLKRVLKLELPQGPAVFDGGAYESGKGRRYFWASVGRMSEDMQREIKEAGETVVLDAKMTAGSTGGHDFRMRNTCMIAIALGLDEDLAPLEEHRGMYVAFKSAVKLPSDYLRPSNLIAPKGKAPADVFSLEAKPGLYKVGKPLRLGRILEDGVEYPFVLFVVDR